MIQDDEKVKLKGEVRYGRPRYDSAGIRRFLYRRRLTSLGSSIGGPTRSEIPVELCRVQAKH
jgi:hypothetical protein